MVQLRTPGLTRVSHGGEVYIAKKGIVEVPECAVEPLLRFGLERVTPPKPKEEVKHGRR